MNPSYRACRQDMEEFDFSGKDESSLAIYMNYLSMTLSFLNSLNILYINPPFPATPLTPV